MPFLCYALSCFTGVCPPIFLFCCNSTPLVLICWYLYWAWTLSLLDQTTTAILLSPLFVIPFPFLFVAWSCFQCGLLILLAMLCLPCLSLSSALPSLLYFLCFTTARSWLGPLWLGREWVPFWVLWATTTQIYDCTWCWRQHNGFSIWFLLFCYSVCLMRVLPAGACDCYF